MKKNILQKTAKKSSISFSAPIMVGAAAFTAIAGAVGFWWYKRSQNQDLTSLNNEEPIANGNAQDKTMAPFVHPSEHIEEGAQDWDRTDEASWESFPASDAPASHNITRSSPVRH